MTTQEKKTTKPTRKTPKKASKKLRMPQGTELAVAGTIAGLILGGIFGVFVIGPGSTAANVTNLNETTAKSDQLSQIIASYTYKGKNYTVSLQDAVNYLGGTTNENGDYEMPSTDEIVAFARSEIVNLEAQNANIEATDEEVTDYIKDYFEVEDISELEQFGYNQDQIKDLARRNVMLDKLQTSIIGEKRYEEPKYPTPAEDGKEDEATTEYADYIKSLAGDAWTGDKWADTEDGKAFSEAFGAEEGATFDGSTANYKAANVAFQVAYQKYSQLASEQTLKWTEYTNDLYKGSTITVATLVQ